MLDQAQIDGLRMDYAGDKQLFINGNWRPASNGARLDVVSPINGKKLATLAQAGSADVDDAVQAARNSFDIGVWSKAAPAYRKQVLHKVADLILEHSAELAVLGVQDNGTEIAMAQKAEPGSAAGTFRFYAEAVDKISGDVTASPDNVVSLIQKEPVGVVAAIVPWNFPLMIAAWKLGPALAAGNSIVLKPAETASLSLLRLVELCAEAGLPDGVLNIVTGEGPVTGKALGLHMDVDVMVFTGSGFVGRKLLEYSAQSNLKRCYLELGGKSPNLVFDDCADLSVAAKASATGFFRNSGQVCVAPSRMLVQRSIYNDFVDQLVKHTASILVGDPLNLATQTGAINNAAQLSKDLLFVEQAKQDGASLLTGGNQILEDTGGYYMQPTLFADVEPASQLAQEEAFGPIMGVIPFEDEAEAVTLANDSKYGLAGYVWSDNLSRAHRMVGAIKSGVIHVNCVGGADITVPLTGFKQSGNGSDKSLHAFDKYLESKTAWIQL